jgi:CRP/FNR family cyclic AMP-dependent transcriptional regulator
MSDIERKYENLMKIGMGGLDAVDSDIIGELGRTFEKGEFLIKEGETSKDVFLIIEGKVIVTKEVNTINKVLALLGPGEIVGEMSFFESTERSASCIADTSVTAIILNEDVFGQIYSLHPRWVGQILQALSRRIVKTLDLLKDRVG